MPTLTLRRAGLVLCSGFALAVQPFTSPMVSAQDATPFDAIGDDNARTALRTIIADAAARGLPTAPLVTKVREGLAKKATPDRIRTATSALADRLALAASALAPTRSNDELAAAADALQAGIPVSTLRDMRKLWPGKPLTVPLGVLAEMVQSGVSRTVATRRVRELLVKGASAGQFANLGTVVRNDIASGLAPDAAMELRSKGVMSLLNSQAAGMSNGLVPASTPPRPRNK
jgi:hypothetical protein